MRDINDYVGVPWVQGGHDRRGSDCWGLVVMVLADVYGVQVERFVGSKASGDALQEIIVAEESVGPWSPCGPIDGAVAVMVDKATGRPEHVGIFVEGVGVLHSLSAQPNGASSITPLPVIRRAFRDVRFYQYAHNRRLP